MPQRTPEDNLRQALAESRALNERRSSPDYKRHLTDDDVDAIAEALQRKVTDQFYQDLGKGVWGWVKKGFFALLIAAAAYGYFNGHFPTK